MGQKTNYVHDDAVINAAATDPATTVVGDPCLVGGIPGVVAEKEDSDGKSIIRTRGVFRLSVEGTDGATAGAVAVGDKIYYTSSRDPKLSKTSASSVQFGYALETVASGATTAILVMLKGA